MRNIDTKKWTTLGIDYPNGCGDNIANQHIRDRLSGSTGFWHQAEAQQVVVMGEDDVTVTGKGHITLTVPDTGYPRLRGREGRELTCQGSKVVKTTSMTRKNGDIVEWKGTG